MIKCIAKVISKVSTNHLFSQKIGSADTNDIIMADEERQQLQL